MNQRSKIFCIGLNKTGTTSLHEAFKILGLRSVHFIDENKRNIKDIIEENHRNGDDILQGIENYDAFSDWNKDSTSLDIYKKFDEHYPNSKFIMHTRDLESWLDSREKHVKRNQVNKAKYPNAEINWVVVDRPAWEAFYKQYHKDVYQYFEGREADLLTIDLTKGEGWEKLCPFLGYEIPDLPFPKANVAPRKKIVETDINPRTIASKVKQRIKRIFE